jgi:anion transporter
MLVPIALTALGILKPSETFAQFGNEYVILFIGMFIVGEAFFRTGMADLIGKKVVHLAGDKRSRLVVLIMLVSGVMSAFLSNTGTAAVFIPLVVGMAASAKLKPGQLLMPLAFAVSLGGTITLVGTPPNGLINAEAAKAVQAAGGASEHLRAFGFFEYAWIGVPLLAVGILYYWLIGWRFLPQTEGAELEEHQKNVQYRTGKMWVAVAIFAMVIAAMALPELLPKDLAKKLPFLRLDVIAMLGACLVIVTRCVTMREAFRSISTTTVWLFAGMLTMSTAMERSGAARMLGEWVVSWVHSPHLLLVVIFAITAIVTNFMSNTATAALMAPIGIAMAKQMGISPMPILMGIGVAASCCFVTPIGTPPNTMVLGPGGYTFWHYFKAGWPLQLLSFIIGVLLIPLIWPFKV